MQVILKKSPVSTTEKISEGLCVNCKNRELCIYKDPHSVVLQCEEYEAFPSPQAKKFTALSTEQMKSTNQKELREYKGLCITCESRENCSYSRGDYGG